MKKIALVILSVAMFASQASAQDFATAISKTVSEIPDGADVASMGSANTALTSDYSTRNPGAVDASDAPRGKGGVSATYANISFKNGPDVNLYIVSGAVRLPVGTLQVSYSDGGSNNGKIDEFGDSLKFNSFPSLDVQYGFKLANSLIFSGDELYVGVGYCYSQSKLTSMQFTDTDFLGTTSKTTSNTLETGMLYRINKNVNVGVMQLHSWDKEEDAAEGFAQTLYSHSDQLRIGVSAKVTSLTMLSADYRHLYLPGGAHDDQYFAGVEQYLIKDTLAIYGGYADGGLTTGLGIYLPNGGINFAYMHRAFRQSEEFMGRTETYMVSLYMNF